MSSAARKHPLNPVAPENLLDPAPLYRELRENDPVHWSSAVNAWFLTRHDDVMSAFRDSRLSADRMQLTEFQLQNMGGDVARDIIDIIRKEMVMKDGREHLRLRRNSGQGFTPQALDAWLPSIRRTMNRLVDGVLHLGRMDLATEISYQLPPLVIAELFGIPAEERTRFVAWAQPINEFFAPAIGGDMVALARRANQAMVESRDFMTALVEERMRAPGDDMLSQMVRRQEAGGASVEEIVANALLILSAGHMTTTDQLGNGVHALLTHPTELRKLREDPSLVKSAVEEMLRYDPPIPWIHRVAVETFELRGRTLRKGDMVFLGMAAANRDPEVFARPDSFDVGRDHQNQKHMSFAFGPHHCLGAGLARRELEVAFSVLLERLPDLRLDEERLPRLKCHSLLFRGFDSLPVRWTPGELTDPRRAAPARP
jgi:cytochrome P450 PksS